MAFKFLNTEVRLSFSFLAILLLFLIKDTRHLLLASLIFSLLHELVHILFLIIFRCRIERVSLSLFGGNIFRNCNDKTTPLKETIIHLSAPAFNLILGALICVFCHGNHWGHTNIFIGAFNIIPFYNFDGGNALYHFLLNFVDKYVAESIITITSCIFVVLFTAFNLLLSIINGINISFIVINIYLISIFIYKLFKKTTNYV